MRTSAWQGLTIFQDWVEETSTAALVVGSVDTGHSVPLCVLGTLGDDFLAYECLGVVEVVLLALV